MTRKKSFTLVFITYIGLLLFGGLVYYYISNLGYEPIYSMLFADVLITFLVFLISMKINNSSLYDPYWSVIPPFVVFGWMVSFNSFNFYSYVLLVSVMIWSYRLTRNWVIDFVGFTHEDFRYVDFREKFGKYYWIISFLGIHLFPTLIVFASLVPIYFVIEQGVTSPVYIYLGSFIMIAGALICFYADGQRREHKKQYPNKSIRSGLWKYSRHPNYFGEVLFWAGAAVASFASGFYLIALFGFIGMVMLFNFYSVPKMEEKLLKNKDDYHEVIRDTPRFFIRPNQIEPNEE